MAPDDMRRFREVRGWTQKEMADRLGVSPAAVSLWESGQRPITRSMVLLIAMLGERFSELQQA